MEKQRSLRVRASSWRKFAIRGNGIGERAPRQIKAERINSRLGSWKRRLGAVLHCGIVSLTAATTDWADKRAAREGRDERDAVSWCVRALKSWRAAECRVQCRRAVLSTGVGVLGYSEQLVGVAGCGCGCGCGLNAQAARRKQAARSVRVRGRGRGWVRSRIDRGDCSRRKRRVGGESESRLPFVM
jgi:hypothetical protein